MEEDILKISSVKNSAERTLRSFLGWNESRSNSDISGLIGASTDFMLASDGVLSEGYGYDEPGVCLDDDQTEAERVPSQCGRGDALLKYITDAKCKGASDTGSIVRASVL